MSEHEAALDRADNHTTMALAQDHLLLERQLVELQGKYVRLEKELSDIKNSYSARDSEARLISFGLYDIAERARDLNIVGLSDMAESLRRLPGKYSAAKFEELISAAVGISAAMHDQPRGGSEE